MNYTEEDLDKVLDKLLIERGEHPTRVRNPLYGEERDLAKRLVKNLTAPVIMSSTLLEPRKWFVEKFDVTASRMNLREHNGNDVVRFIREYLDDLT